VAKAPTFEGPGAWANSFRLDTIFVVLWGPLLFWAMRRFKLWKSLRIYLVISLFVEAFSETMFRKMGEGGYWDSILWPANVAWYGTIKEFAGVPGASLSVFALVTGFLLYRATTGPKPDGWTAPEGMAGRKLASGTFALQGHDPCSRVEYRNIRVRPLD
jgi:hypothetical protein